MILELFCSVILISTGVVAGFDSGLSCGLPLQLGNESYVIMVLVVGVVGVVGVVALAGDASWLNNSGVAL